MKLKKFKGKQIRGYMDFDIEFDESLTFLIGINGTGKTTILKLLAGLLSPSYIELAQIDFTEIELVCEKFSNTESKIIKLSCYKANNKFKLKIEEPEKSKEIENEFQLYEISSFMNSYGREPIDVEKLHRVVYDFEELDVVRYIKELKTPLFLGLNRRTVDKNKIAQFERDFYSRRRFSNFDFMYDSVDSALNEIREMFYNHVRQKAQSQYAISEQFRKKVFAESFKVEENYPISNIEYSQELEKLEKRRQELNNAIDNLDVKDLSKQFAEYFDSIKRALEILSSTSSFDETGQHNQEYVKALLQWMIKSSQIEKIDNIIRYANEYSNSIQRLKEPINRFVDSVNLFFKESRKEIEIDNKGEVIIKAENTTKRFTVFELSSGEKQLIIMLAHIAFNYKNKNSSILIIDEPELSLHISWQELFVDALLKASPNAQYILATHAPAIIAHVERRDNCIDLTNMN